MAMRGLSVAVLSALAHVSRPTVTAALQGRRINVKTAIAISNCLSGPFPVPWQGVLGAVTDHEPEVWLGRKDSNLQPSDPESAALPLRHSPNLLSRGLHCSSYCLAFGAVLQSVGRRQIVADFVTSSLGRSRCRPSEAPRFLPPVGLLLFGPNPSLRLLPGDDDVRLLGTLRPHSHPNRERFAGPHQPAERVLHQRLRAVQVDRPTDPENPVAE